MQFLGALLLITGIMVMIVSFPGVSNLMLPSWASGVGAAFVLFSYLLSWGNKGGSF